LWIFESWRTPSQQAHGYCRRDLGKVSRNVHG
jgi:hypothetical protein